MVENGESPVAAARGARAAAVLRRPEPLVFVLALLARSLPMVKSGVFSGAYNSDAGVYYSAADGIAHGQVPYRDFVLLHPPGLILFEVPFAWLGRLTTDMTGFLAANVAIILLCGVNAVLAMRVARALGLGRRSERIAGLGYALWFGAVVSEYLPRLEPLGNTFLLLGLLAYFRARGADASWRWPLLAGVALGAGACVKVWWVVPIGVLLGWHLLVERRGRSTAQMVAGLAIAATAIDGPFYLLAGSKMFHMIVSDQFGRPVGNANLLKPYAFLAVGWLSSFKSDGWLLKVDLIALVVFTWVIYRAWRTPAARVIVVVLLAQLVLIAIEPSWFTFYADYVTVPFALTVAAATRRSPAAAPDRLVFVRWLTVPTFGAGLAALLLGTVPTNFVLPFPRTAVSRAVAEDRCVLTDNDMSLISINRLSSDFAAHCQDLVDIGGAKFDLARRLGFPSAHLVNVAWDRAMAAYLTSGDATVMTTPRTLKGLSPTTGTEIVRGGVIFRHGSTVVYRTSPDGPVPAGAHLATNQGATLSR